MKQNLFARLRVAILLVPVTAGILVGLGTGLGQEAFGEDPAKKPPDPFLGLSVQEREKRIAEAWAVNSKWVVDFVQEARDPSALPVDILEAWFPPVNSISDALSKSTAVVEGKVISTTYFADSTGMTHSLATVEVSQVARGNVTQSTIEIVQFGGPTRGPSGGVLQQLDIDPLLLSGQQVVLLLIPAASEVNKAGNVYNTLPRAGVYLVTPSGIQAQPGNVFAAEINGRSLSDALSLFK